MDVKAFERIERKFQDKIINAVLIDEFNNCTILEPFTYQPIALNYHDEGIE